MNNFRRVLVSLLEVFSGLLIAFPFRVSFPFRESLPFGNPIKIPAIRSNLTPFPSQYETFRPPVDSMEN